MDNRWKGLTLVACAWFGCGASPAVQAEQPLEPSISTQDRDFFESRVRPLLVDHCIPCHGGTKAAGGFSLQSAMHWRQGGESGPAIIPGAPDQSRLIDAINYRSLEMPPADEGGRLTEQAIDVLTQWVARGAPDPRDGSDIIGGMTRDEARNWWSFQPLPQYDQAVDVAADVNQIDAWVHQELNRNGLQPAAKADRRTLLRRMSYGLTGLPPSDDDLSSFIADGSPQAVAHVIERLLQSPQYGVHWGRHWLDVVRYADTAGENTDRPLMHAWRYRNWVMEAFNRDLPFTEFVQLQLSGDLIAGERPESQRAECIVATGYLAIARRFGHDIDKDMYLTHEDVIDNLGKNFLGLTLGCARCHDHKYDPISAPDYYALYGIFDSTQFAFPGCEPKGQPRDMVPLLTERQVEALMQPWNERAAAFQAEKQRRMTESLSASEALRSTWSSSQRTLVKSNVEEGGSVSFDQSLEVRRGEVVLLTVAPNDGHGADSTLLEWTIAEVDGDQRVWHLNDVVMDLIKGNSWPAAHDASWSFLEVTSAPVFLTESRDAINDRNELKSWSLGSEPSVFVNRSDQPVMVWTTLPAKSLFVHPGPSRPVAVAWASPIDGPVRLTGRVADAHPAGLDGVSFQLDHVTDPHSGPLLAKVQVSVATLPDPGPAPEIPVAYAVVDRDPRNSRLHERGDPEKLGDPVSRRWLTVFGGTAVPGDSGSGRRELADWVVDHPLFARVMVNRIWHWHFGTGLVRSANDFGARGELPSHPELLDFLAAKFVQSGYSVKAMHRLIMQTDTYRRASESPNAIDPDNRWLAHFTRRRLTAEELRDSLLKVSGQLDLSMGQGHPFPAEQSWTFTQHAPFNAVYETHRRSAFLMVQRQRRHPFLSLFDGADPNASTATRQTTTVPTQALYFINDPFFHEQADRFANLLLQQPDQDHRFHVASRMLFQREWSSVEREWMQQFLNRYPGQPAEKWSALARVWLASNEFLSVD